MTTTIPHDYPERVKAMLDRAFALHPLPLFPMPEPLVWAKGKAGRPKKHCERVQTWDDLPLTVQAEYRRRRDRLAKYRDQYETNRIARSEGRISHRRWAGVERSVRVQLDKAESRMKELEERYGVSRTNIRG